VDLLLQLDGGDQTLSSTLWRRSDFFLQLDGGGQRSDLFLQLDGGDQTFFFSFMEEIRLLSSTDGGDQTSFFSFMEEIRLLSSTDGRDKTSFLNLRGDQTSLQLDGGEETTVDFFLSQDGGDKTLSSTCWWRSNLFFWLMIEKGFIYFMTKENG
jgi:hypothetical protein